MIIAYLGPKGTFSYSAAKEIAEKRDSLVPCSSLTEIIEKIATQQVNRGILPTYNTALGKLYDIPPGFKAIDTIAIPVPMCIGGKGSLDKLVAVYSKAEALQQCTKILEKIFKTGLRSRNAEGYVDFLKLQNYVIFTDSTVAAIQKVSKSSETNIAAIGPKDAFPLYNLPILSKDIEDKKGAKTTFALVAKA